MVAFVALVVGSMIGGGVFSLPQNMAQGASPGAVVKSTMLATPWVFMRIESASVVSGRAASREIVAAHEGRKEPGEALV